MKYIFLIFAHVLPSMVFLGLQFPVQAIPVNAQEKPAFALLRHRENTSTIEVVVEAEFAPKSSHSIALYKAEGRISKKIVRNENVPNCPESFIRDGFCKDIRPGGKIRFTYLFSSPPAAAGKYLVIFSLVDNTRGEIEQAVKVAMDFNDLVPSVEPEYTEEGFSTVGGTGHVAGNSNGTIKIPIIFPFRNTPPIPEVDDYIDERINAIYDYLEPKKIDPASVAGVRVEPQTEPEGPVVYNVTGFKIDPEGRETAKERGEIIVWLITDKKFPPRKFALEVVFGRDAPLELGGRLLNTLPGIAVIKTPDASKAGSDKTLGLRDFKNNLDLAVAFSSAVEEEKVNGVTVRTRKNNGAFDLRFAPILNRAIDRNEMHFITPFFIDAKTSTGKIDKKTLALNRILVGTQYVIRWRPNDGRFNKYIFSFRGMSASDRDFKHAEAKFNFEFRPLFNKLNNPLTVQYVTPLPASVLIPENGFKEIPTGWFGYKIQPLVGIDLGRVYREKRAAFDNEESRNVRRLYFGLDMLFNITKFANLKVSDTYYIRGENRNARYRNYFYGELEAPLVISGETSHSVFFSFERGEQPPFATPSVNSMKVGYRITSNFFGQTP